MKKYLFPLCALLTSASLPCISFADGSNVTPAGEATVKIVWYVVLVVLFSAGLIVISKWSKKINERDAELERQRSIKEQKEAESSEESGETEQASEEPSTEPPKEE